MEHLDNQLDRRPRTSGSAFRRVGATVAVACAVTGSIVGLGAVGALAAPTSNLAGSAATQTPMPKATPPKVTYTAADLAAFSASPYVDDALNLAAIWGTADLTTAKGKAGSKLRAGIPLPYAAGASGSVAYTDEQERTAFFLGGASFTQALGLAVAWGSDTVYTAKATVGGKLLTHQTVPAAPTTYTESDDVAAFGLVGYGDTEAAQLAALWQSPSTRSAKARAGATLLAGGDLPL